MLRTTSLAILLISFGTFVVNGQNNSNPVCPFECFHGSKCSWGQVNTTGHPVSVSKDIKLQEDGKHCACPDGFTGLRCARKFTSCYDNDHKCYHGGKCIQGLEDTFGNDQYFCDCSEARDTHGNRMVGKYCEHKALDTCDKDGEFFCVNGGVCKKNWKDSPHVPCRCGPDHEGPHCEFKKGEVPDCSLNCRNEGHCRLGIKNFALAMLGYKDLWQNNINRMYCECKEGFFGVRCEIQSNKCGDHHCFNGGKCSTASDGSNFCNCTATNEPFAGRYCQYKASSFCEDEKDEDGQDFCTNDGTCKGKGVPGCTCPEKFDGPHCEYRKHEAPVCNLQCQNNGVCVKGGKDLAFLNKFGPNGADLKSMAHTTNFEHCKCPDGFTGLICEKESRVCGDDKHLCLNGGTCITEEDGTYSCDCSTATQNGVSRFAGIFCEHHATQYCTSNALPGKGKNHQNFCVNGGTCKAITNGTHSGCNCKGEYVGSHCQFSRAQVEAGLARAHQTHVKRESRSKEGLGIFLGVFFAIAIVLGTTVFVWIRRKRQGKELDSASMSTQSTSPNLAPASSSDEPILDLGPEKDHEGNELSNVEII